MPHYVKAPILEAVLDLRVTLPEDTIDLDFAKFVDHVRSDFPRQEAISIVEGELRATKDGPVAVPLQHASGYKLGDISNTKVIHVTSGGFTFSKLPPYDRWESFSSDAKKHWDLYKSLANGLVVKRVGLRYISRIDYPKASRMGDYLNIRPLLPQNLPNNDVAHFFLQAQLPQPDIGAYLIINEAAAEPPGFGQASIVLDIDIYAEQDWDAVDDTKIWDLLEKMRLRKNDVFEAAITDKTRELIK